MRSSGSARGDSLPGWADEPTPAGRIARGAAALGGVYSGRLASPEGVIAGPATFQETRVALPQRPRWPSCRPPRRKGAATCTADTTKAPGATPGPFLCARSRLSETRRAPTTLWE
jgi:hypothetical protein